MVLAGMEQLIKEGDNAIQQNKELLQKLGEKTTNRHASSNLSTISSLCFLRFTSDGEISMAKTFLDI
jgi:hypothetical protein